MIFLRPLGPMAQFSLFQKAKSKRAFVHSLFFVDPPMASSIYFVHPLHTSNNFRKPHSVWTRFSSDFQCMLGISDPSCGMLTQVALWLVGICFYHAHLYLFSQFFFIKYEVYLIERKIWQISTGGRGFYDQVAKNAKVYLHVKSDL